MLKVLALPLAFAVVTIASGQTGRFDSHVLRIDAAPRAVTVYRGRATVTRRTSRLLGPGTYELSFVGLPESLQPETLQANVIGPARVAGVEYFERAATEAASPRLAELDQMLAQNEAELTRRGEERRLVEAQEDHLSALSGRAANAAGVYGGTEALDLDAVTEQLAFFRTERTKLLEERRAIDAETRELREIRRSLESEQSSLRVSSRTAREAIVTLAVDGGEITVDLIYAVTNANWTPTYNMRAAVGGARVDIEYEALVEQRTGEDWRDVTLVLSTAQPARAANPPPLAPWYVDVVPPAPTPGGASPRTTPGEAMSPGAPGVTGAPGAPGALADTMGANDGQSIPRTDLPWSHSAAGRSDAFSKVDPAVNYTLARPATIFTDASRRQRARIAAIACRPVYTHVAMPLLTESVYVRSDLRNESDFQLLPGPVAVFVGADYVGPTAITSIAPHQAFEVFFGADRAITVTRTLIAKETAKTGLLGGGRKTSYDYRIDIENGAGKDISLELWDRMPVSRSDRVDIQLVNLSHDLAGDPTYLEELFPQGLLRWDLTIPAGAIDDAATVVSFGVRVARAKDVEVTGLPD